jgi:hypothetical protein
MIAGRPSQIASSRLFYHPPSFLFPYPPLLCANGNRSPGLEFANGVSAQMSYLFRCCLCCPKATIKCVIAGFDFGRLKNCFPPPSTPPQRTHLSDGRGCYKFLYLCGLREGKNVEAEPWEYAKMTTERQAETGTAGDGKRRHFRLDNFIFVYFEAKYELLRPHILLTGDGQKN